MPNTSSGASRGAKNSVENSVVPKIRLTLVQLKSFSLGDSEITARHATDAQFLAFAASLVPLESEEEADLQHWTVEERRDFLNWCLHNGILQIVEHRLMPLEQET